MKLLARIFPVFILAALLSSCSPKTKNPVVGTWESFQDAKKGKLHRITTYDASGRFQEKGTATFLDGKETSYLLSGTWRVEKDIIYFKNEAASFSAVPEDGKLQIRFIDPDTMELHYSNGTIYLNHRVEK